MSIFEKTRFDLEDSLMQCWHVTDDIDVVMTIVEQCQGLSAKDMDKLFNALCGIKTIYDQRFSNTFHLFEQLVKEKKII